MRMHNLAWVLGACLLGVLIAGDALAQARRVTAPGAGGNVVSVSTTREGAVIKKIEGIGQGAKVKTPEIKNDANEPQVAAKDWARITVQYDTDAEWTDELEFRYMVMVKNAKTGAYTMFPANVTYIDIPKGKRHLSTMFLRPATIERYGNVEWIGVKMFLKGEQIAVAQMPENDQRPWTATVKAKEGVLLNRDQTPFGLVAIDSYATIKAR